MGGVKVGAISSGMPSTEEFVGRILHELYCTLFIAFSKKSLRLFVVEWAAKMENRKSRNKSFGRGCQSIFNHEGNVYFWRQMKVPVM
jgi:hypothetical protein